MANIVVQGTTIQVDEEDVSRIQQHKWHLDNNNGFTRFYCSELNMYLHHFVLGYLPKSGRCRFSSDRYDYRKVAFTFFSYANTVLSTSSVEAILDIGGCPVVVSLVDLDRVLKAGPWSRAKNKFLAPRDKYYFQHRAKSNGTCKYELLHRFILGAEEGQIVDHISRDTFDNRRDNLRFCTASQNAHNTKLSSANTSGRKGVRYDGKYWVASIRVGNIRRSKVMLSRGEAIIQREAWEKEFNLLDFLGEVGK